MFAWLCDVMFGRRWNGAECGSDGIGGGGLPYDEMPERRVPVGKKVVD